LKQLVSATLLLLITVSGACKSEEEAKPEASRPATLDIALPELAIPTAPADLPPVLVPSSVPGFDLLSVPTKARFEKADGEDRWYTIEVGLEELIRFYREQGFEVVRNPPGATVRTGEKTRVLRIVPDKGRRFRLMFLSLKPPVAAPGGKTPVPADIPPDMAEKIRKGVESGDPDVDKLFPKEYQR